MNLEKTKLTPKQIERLDRLESVILKGQQTFVEVGNALCEIREEKLYLRDYDSFEAYCQQKWGWSRQRGSQLIKAAELVGNLPPTLAAGVLDEWDARALIPLEPKQQKDAIREAAKKGVSVAETAKSFLEKPVNIGSSQSTHVDTYCAPIIDLDKTGFKIPKKCLPIWARRDEVQKLLSAVSMVRSALRNAREADDHLWRPVAATNKADTWTLLLTSLDKAYTAIGLAMPYAVCPTCQGQNADRCTVCQERGMVSEFFYKNCVPSEVRKIRETACRA